MSKFVHKGGSVLCGNPYHIHSYFSENLIFDDSSISKYLINSAEKILEVGITDFEIWYHHFKCLREEDMALFLLSFT